MNFLRIFLFYQVFTYENKFGFDEYVKRFESVNKKENELSLDFRPKHPKADHLKNFIQTNPTLIKVHVKYSRRLKKIKIVLRPNLLFGAALILWFSLGGYTSFSFFDDFSLVPIIGTYILSFFISSFSLIPAYSTINKYNKLINSMGLSTINKENITT